jgi:hypothetical protein
MHPSERAASIRKFPRHIAQLEEILYDPFPVERYHSITHDLLKMKINVIMLPMMTQHKSKISNVNKNAAQE